MSPRQIRRAAAWWRREARTSKNPGEILRYAKNLWSLASDMERRPKHYARKPLEYTAWQWSQQ